MSQTSHEGHRERLRKKFIESGLKGFHDYEIVELLLTLGTPRKDCKQLAKEALKKFGSLRGVLEASSEEFREIRGIGHQNIFGIKLIREVTQEFLKEKIIKKEFCKSARDVFNYLYSEMSGLKKEIFKVLFLDSKNRILKTENLFEGTLDKSAVYPREIMKKAIKNNAVGLIFVHNHPSGDPEPSQGDKDITRALISVGNIMEIKVLDHIIIGDNKYYSFAEHQLIS